MSKKTGNHVHVNVHVLDRTSTSIYTIYLSHDQLHILLYKKATKSLLWH